MKRKRSTLSETCPECDAWVKVFTAGNAAGFFDGDYLMCPCCGLHGQVSCGGEDESDWYVVWNERWGTTNEALVFVPTSVK